MDFEKLAERLLPEKYPALETYETKYPPRNLAKGAEVTRLAPSPTGFIHLGNLFVAIANERIAHQSGGVLYLRIEDTDEKRKVDGAVDAVKNALRYFDIKFDEGAEIEGAENAYAPYYQRQRALIPVSVLKKRCLRSANVRLRKRRLRVITASTRHAAIFRKKRYIKISMRANLT